MPFCIVCALCRSYLSRSPGHTINSAQQSSFPSDITRELDELHRCLFNSLSTLLAILTLSGSKTLAPAVLALLIYTISLRLAASARFIQTYPTVSSVLHVVPLLCIVCVAGVELVSGMRSRALAVILLMSCALPFIMAAVHWDHGRHGEQTPLPVRMREPLPIV